MFAIFTEHKHSSTIFSLKPETFEVHLAILQLDQLHFARVERKIPWLERQQISATRSGTESNSFPSEEDILLKEKLNIQILEVL